MTIEAGVVITKLGCLWHLPPGRSAGYLPDSPDLWQQLWDNREILEGFAHSHPGRGAEACSPSDTDITTFDAVERALGRNLKWWICSADSMRLYTRVVDCPVVAYDWEEAWLPAEKWPHRMEPTPPLWLHTLREISGHYVMMFQCVGCEAPCEFGSREPMLGWGCEGGSVVPGDWASKREMKSVAKTCVFCDPTDEYKRTGEVPKRVKHVDDYRIKTLDALATPAGAARMKSGYRTETCTIWDSHEQLWIESDASLRERLK